MSTQMVMAGRARGSGWLLESWRTTSPWRYLSTAGLPKMKRKKRKRPRQKNTLTSITDMFVEYDTE